MIPPIDFARTRKEGRHRDSHFSHCAFAPLLEIFAVVLTIVIAGSGLHAQTKSVPKYQPATNADDAVARIEELGGSVRRVALKGEALEVDFRNSNVADVHLQYLFQLKMVTVVRLRETSITDAGLAHLGKIATLKRLHLEKTAITDAGLQHLTALKNLHDLNLFGTNISDAGLDRLKAIPSLKTLFVFQTKASAAGIAKLQKSLPGLQVVPDPTQDRRHAEAALKIATAAREVAERKLASAKKDAETLAPRAAQLKKELDEATRQTADAKKKFDESKKKADDATRRAKEVKAQASLAQKKAQTNPGDVGLKKLAEVKRLDADAANQLALDLRKLADQSQKAFQASKARSDAVRQQSNKAGSAQKNAEEAQKYLEYYRQLELDARKKLTESQIATPR